MLNDCSTSCLLVSLSFFCPVFSPLNWLCRVCGKVSVLFSHGYEAQTNYCRYLKRGVNERGRVANDVETEQILIEDVPEGLPLQISSVVQNRGSIPLFWSQETSRLNIKPDIICMFAQLLDLYFFNFHIYEMYISSNLWLLYCSVKEGPNIWGYKASFWKSCQEIWESHHYFEFD